YFNIAVQSSLPASSSQRPKPEHKILKCSNALISSGFATASMTNVEEVLANEITVFEDRVRIDVQTSTSGITFSNAWKKRKVMNYHGQEFYVLSKDDLITSKRAAGRDVDLEDVKILENIRDDEEDEQGQ
ncbi:MAG: hypothetical protein JW804_05130, partial [Sedimentisphaerales bacterium]|nr:hypothetical protein [Sedimentisphaerales bacterium]